jgi:TolB-like protein/Flp pilus assembly protein TadD
MDILSDLKRRNVHRMAGLYLVGSWLIVQVAATIFPVFGFGDLAVRVTVILLAIGFVPALVLAWVFELTPAGLKRERDIHGIEVGPSQAGKRMDRLIMTMLALALGYFAFDKFVLAPQREAVQTETARQEGRSAALAESYGDKSIAVLPFVDLSPDKDQEYFSDGIAEELLNLLTRIPDLRVISRSSAFSFKGKDIAMPEIARQLNVANVLEGSVRKSGDTVRITAQLIEARSDTHLWSQTWDRELHDIFGVQDEIAAAVVSQLRVQLLGDAPKARKVDPAAYALYLRARQLTRQFTPEGFAQSTALYRQALVLQPDYAAAWDGLARNYTNQTGYGLLPVTEGARLAREAAEKALELDASYAPAYDSLGWIAKSYDGDLAAAARNFEHALSLQPADTIILASAAVLALDLDRLDTAITLSEYVVAQDPINPISLNNLAYAYFFAGRVDEAIAALHSAAGLAPDMIAVQYWMGLALLAKGDPEAALREVQKEADEGWRLFGLTMVYHALGREEEADATLAEAIAKYEQDSAYNIAYILADRGEVGRAFEWLDRAVAYRDPGLSEIAVQPLFANLKSDPRWLPLLRKLGKAPEQLAAIPFEVKLPH